MCRQQVAHRGGGRRVGAAPSRRCAFGHRLPGLARPPRRPSARRRTGRLRGARLVLQRLERQRRQRCAAGGVRVQVLAAPTADTDRAQSACRPAGRTASSMYSGWISVPSPSRPFSPVIGATRVSIRLRRAAETDRPSKFSARPAISLRPAARPARPWLRTSASVSQAAISRSLVVSVKVCQRDLAHGAPQRRGIARIGLALCPAPRSASRASERASRRRLYREVAEMSSRMSTPCGASPGIGASRRREIETFRKVRHCTRLSICWTMVPRNT